MQEFDLQLSLDVYLIVVFGRLAINILLTVLAHHDERSGISSLERECEIEQDEWIGVPPFDIGGDVENDPGKKNDRLQDDKRPGAHHGGDCVCYSLTRCELAHIFVPLRSAKPLA